MDQDVVSSAYTMFTLYKPSIWCRYRHLIYSKSVVTCVDICAKPTR